MLIAALPFLAWLAPLLNATPPFLNLDVNLLNAVLLFFILLAQLSIAAPQLLHFASAIGICVAAMESLGWFHLDCEADIPHLVGTHVELPGHN